MYKDKDEENKALIRENGHLEERVRMLESKLSDCAHSDALKVQELVFRITGDCEACRYKTAFIDLRTLCQLCWKPITEIIDE